MLVANEKPTGTSYTATAALLILGLVFIPAILIASRPIGDFSLGAAIAGSVICIGLARMNWLKSSKLAFSSIIDSGKRTK